MTFLSDLLHIRPPVTIANTDPLLKQTGYLDPREEAESTAKTERIPDLSDLRHWATTHPIVFAAMKQLINPVAGQKWLIRPKNPKDKSDDVLMRVELATQSLRAPNPHGRNQSLRTLLRATLLDVEVGDIGVLLPQTDGRGRVLYVHHIDPWRVEFVKGWESEADGKRYKLYSQNRRHYRWLDNRELIVIQNNPLTWDERGLPAIRVLHDTLEADAEVFLSQWQKQKREAPTGILNMPKAQRRVVDAVETYYRSRIEGKATIGVANLPADTTFIRIGNPGGASEWLHFTDTEVRKIAIAMDLMPTDLGWTQNTHQATAEFESEKSAERALKPRLDNLLETLNREWVSTWGDDIELIWVGTGTKDQSRLAQIIQILDQTHAWGKNELRAMWGELPLLYDDPVEQALANDPIFQNRDQPPIPLTMYAAMLKTQYPDAAAMLGVGSTPGMVTIRPVPQRQISGPVGSASSSSSSSGTLRQSQDETEEERTAREQHEAEMERYALVLNAIATERWQEEP